MNEGMLEQIGYFEMSVFKGVEIHGDCFRDMCFWPLAVGDIFAFRHTEGEQRGVTPLLQHLGLLYYLLWSLNYKTIVHLRLTLRNLNLFCFRRLKFLTFELIRRFWIKKFNLEIGTEHTQSGTGAPLLSAALEPFLDSKKSSFSFFKKNRNAHL